MMRIYGPIFALLGIAKLVVAQQYTYPSCLNKQCYEWGASYICTGQVTAECVCKTGVVLFFTFLHYCAGFYCQKSDVDKIMLTAADECKGSGYDVDVDSVVDLSFDILNYSFSVSLPTQTIEDISSPSSSSNTDNGDSDSGGGGGKGMSTGAIIGIVVGGVAVIAIVAGLIVFCTKHRARERQREAMAASSAALLPPPPPPPPGPLPVMSPPPMSQYSTPPPGYAYTPPLYAPQPQPHFQQQQQQQPLLHGYQQQPVQGYYPQPNKEPSKQIGSIPTAATTTPASAPVGQNREYFQELSDTSQPVAHASQPVAYANPPVTHSTLAQEGQVYVEMPGDIRK